MGEPIHIIANRGGQLWAELDKTIFSLDRKKRGAVIAAKKNYIISRLNADFSDLGSVRMHKGSLVTSPI
jgi:fatty acid synthase subunit beta